ncbi:LamG-like jellyroll fold domain-containing protein [Polaribacter sp. KT25b]|uniref:LamG-like jellyroll fold domain-containing protein n=1 Tax=Polaribacter sp. KT25b TaxID=1855336 RepID=UPI0015609E5C|nr:LamG-like jellyroll fold domain-containing protein [Polaribacter sp. KT25b]
MKQKTTFFKLALIIALFCITRHNINAQTLEAHYKFDSSITDETGNWNLTATDEDNSITYEMGQDGTANGAITGFDRGDLLSTVTNFPISGDASRTMTAWIKLIALTPQTAVVGGGENSPGKKWTFGHQGAKVRAEINGKGMGVGTLEVDVWHHIAVVWDKDNSTVRIYQNGELKGSNTTWSTNTTEAPLLIGNDYNADPKNRGFNGAMDDVRIYTGAGDDAFIKSIYDATLLSVNDNIVKTSLNAFPNPVVDYLSFSSDKISSVEIYNILGAKVKSQKVNNKSIDMSYLSKGVYMIKCKDANHQNIGTIKAIKE